MSLQMLQFAAINYVASDVARSPSAERFNAIKLIDKDSDSYINVLTANDYNSNLSKNGNCQNFLSDLGSLTPIPCSKDSENTSSAQASFQLHSKKRSCLLKLFPKHFIRKKDVLPQLLVNTS